MGVLATLLARLTLLDYWEWFCVIYVTHLNLLYLCRCALKQGSWAQAVQPDCLSFIGKHCIHCKNSFLQPSSSLCPCFPSRNARGWGEWEAEKCNFDWSSGGPLKEQKGKQENHKNTVVEASESMTHSWEHNGTVGAVVPLSSGCFWILAMKTPPARNLHWGGWREHGHGLTYFLLQCLQWEKLYLSWEQCTVPTYCLWRTWCEPSVPHRGAECRTEARRGVNPDLQELLGACVHEPGIRTTHPFPQSHLEGCRSQIPCCQQFFCLPDQGPLEAPSRCLPCVADVWRKEQFHIFP